MISNPLVRSVTKKLGVKYLIKYDNKKILLQLECFKRLRNPSFYHRMTELQTHSKLTVLFHYTRRLCCKNLMLFG